MKSIGILAIFFAALTASAQSPTTFEWEGTLEAKQTLQIRNIIGDIKAETSSGSDAEISVQIVGTRPDPSTIRIDIVPYDGGILACTIYLGISHPEHCTPDLTPNLTLSNSDIRVNYTVRLPAGVNFAPHTINGNVSADLPGSSISAGTVNGRIILFSNQPADAHSVNGSIVATLGDVSWEGTREFGTVNGTIDLEVPESCHAKVHAANVWGSLANDFAIMVHRNFVGSWFTGDINGGGPSSLVLNTVNGSIHLRRPPAQ